MNSPGTPPGPRASVLETFLSKERLGPYRAAMGGELDRALRLYEWNAHIGAALLEVLGHLEVVLRNALHGQLHSWQVARHLPGEWYDNASRALDPHRLEDIRSARDRLRRDRKPEAPGRVIAELTFGFWRFLLGPRYQNTLWTHALRHAFPHLQPQRRSAIYAPVHELSRLRNRIAHHEPIHHLRLGDMHDHILHLSGYIHGDVRVWIARESRVPDLLEAKPR